MIFIHWKYQSKHLFSVLKRNSLFSHMRRWKDLVYFSQKLNSNINLIPETKNIESCFNFLIWNFQPVLDRIAFCIFCSHAFRPWSDKDSTAVCFGNSDQAWTKAAAYMMSFQHCYYWEKPSRGDKDDTDVWFFPSPQKLLKTWKMQKAKLNTKFILNFQGWVWHDKNQWRLSLSAFDMNTQSKGECHQI